MPWWTVSTDTRRKPNNNNAKCKSHAHGHVLYVNTTNKTKRKQKIITQNCEQQQELRRRQCQLVPPSGEPASCTRTNERQPANVHTHAQAMLPGTERERTNEAATSSGRNRLPREKHSLYDCEILQQQVAFGFRGEARYALPDAELNGGHKFRGGSLWA